jgi:hypothetical protein
MTGTIRTPSQSTPLFETILPRTQRPQPWMNAVNLLCKFSRRTSDGWFIRCKRCAENSIRKCPGEWRF